MRISKLYLPAVTLAGALALAGCGGGSSTPAATDNPGNPGERETNAGDCGEGTMLKDGKCVPDAESEKTTHDTAATFHNILNEPDVTSTAAENTTGKIGIMIDGAGFKARQNASYARAALRGGRLEPKDGTVNAPGGAFSSVYGTPDGQGAGAVGYYQAGRSGNLPVQADVTADGVASQTTRMAVAEVFATVGSKSHRTDSGIAGVPGSETPYFETKGTYHGVSGTFRCVGDGTVTCGSRITAAGALELTFTGGSQSATLGWFFKPDSLTAQVIDQGRWGWWYTLDRGVNVGSADVFFHSNGSPRLVDSAGLDTLGGSATYEGEAGGLYSVHGVEGDEGDSGAFEAKVTLTATFGNAATSGLSGEVHDFTGDDGTSRNWRVLLNDDSDSATSNLSATGVADGSTRWVRDASGGSRSDADTIRLSEWEARMYEGTSTSAPSAVLGGFHAEHDVGGQMIGAFGACISDPGCQ